MKLIIGAKNIYRVIREDGLRRGYPVPAYCALANAKHFIKTGKRVVIDANGEMKVYTA